MIEQCWICGGAGNLTGEHIPKKSDLYREFGEAALYRHDDKERNVKAQSVGSYKF
jgi:hypothetical protein